MSVYEDISQKFPEIFNTTRLTILFGDQKISADIENGAKLNDALRIMANSLDEVGASKIR